MSLESSFSNQFPFLLTPVQIQVKFVHHDDHFIREYPDRSPQELLVRIFPDVINVSHHEETLTESERFAGETYWRQAGQAPDRAKSQVHSLLAWSNLVEKYGALRGYWILQRTTPTNIAQIEDAARDDADKLPEPKFRDSAMSVSSWNEPAQAFNLPDYFVVTLYNQIKDPAQTGDPAGNGDPLFQDLLMSQLEVSSNYPDNVTELTAEFLEVVRTVRSQDVAQNPLQVGPHPQAGEKDGPPNELDENTGLAGNLAWLTDFEAALKQGMAVAVPINDEKEAELGFKRLVVVGVHREEDPERGAENTAQLLNRHFYSEGFEIVPQGTPTNNTAQGAGYSSADIYDAEASFRQLLQGPLFTVQAPDNRIQQSDGQRLTGALGLQAEALQQVRYAGGNDGRDAMLLNQALWPGTYGYFMDTALHPLFSQDRKPVEATRWFFEQFVSGRGGVPAIRVSNEPYGILPTTQYSAWVPPKSLDKLSPDYGKQLWSVTRRFNVTWTERLSGLVRYPSNKYEVPFNVPPVGQQDFLTVLGHDASSVEAYQRYTLGPVVIDTLASQAASTGGNIWPQISGGGQRDARIGRFGAPSHTNPDKLAMHNNPLYSEFLELFDPGALFGNSAFGLKPLEWPQVWDKTLQSNFRKVVHTFADEPRPAWAGAPGGMVDGLPFSETAPVQNFPELKLNFIGWLATADFDEIRVENFAALYGGNVPATFQAPNTLFYRLLRHAVLLEHLNAALANYEDLGRALSREESELFNIERRGPARWEVLYMDNPDNGNRPFYKDLRGGYGRGGKALVAYLDNVLALASLPTARLERVLAEHLDLGTYRLDAWMRAQVELRLAELRMDRPTGVYTGCFGWLEDVKRQDRSEPKDGVFTDPDNLGYLHAPTLNHATAAAVLRQGYKSRQFSATKNDPVADRMAVNLSSERVRRALATLESIRTGQSLAAVLGQYFEKGLLEDTNAIQLSNGRKFASLIPDMRRQFPYSREKAVLGQQAPAASSVSEQDARQVIDGLALLKAGKAANYYPFSSPISSATSEPGLAAAVRRELLLLADTLDAMGDLTIGESVYQAVVGNVEQAGAMLENVAKGRFPAAPEVVHTPRGGTSVTHRVLLHLPSSAPANLALWGNAPSPRAATEPGLNRWLASLLDNPQNISLTYAYTVDGTPVTPAAFTLAQAKLQPIVLLYLTEGNALQAGSALDNHLTHVLRERHHVANQDPTGIGQVHFNFTAAGGPALRNLLPLLHRIRQLLGLARAAVPTDLAGPSRQQPSQLNTGDQTADWSATAAHMTQLRSDMAAAVTLLTDKIDAVRNATVVTADLLWDLRTALHALAAYGIPEADMATVPTLTDLQGAALVVAQLALRRLQAAVDIPVETTSAYYVSAAQVLLGASFRLAPSFALSGDMATTYQQAMTDGRRTELLAEHVNNPLITQEWLQGVSRVREPLDHLEKVILLNELLRADTTTYLPLALTPTQLSARPVVAGKPDYWLGVRFPKDYELPGDAVSLVQILPGEYTAASLTQQAYLLDEWTEVIPSKEEITSVAFHFDQPNTEAPQTLLLAVCPDSNTDREWQWEELLGAVNETLDLAKKRAIEPDALAFTHLGQLLPALVAPVAMEGVTTNLDYRQVNNSAVFPNEPLLSDY